MGEIGHDYQYGTLKIRPPRSPDRGPQYPLGQLTSKTCNKFQNTLKSRKNQEADVDVIVMQNTFDLTEQWNRCCCSGCFVHILGRKTANINVKNLPV